MMRIDLIEMIDQRLLHWEWGNYPLSPIYFPIFYQFWGIGRGDGIKYFESPKEYL